ncbi:ATP-binding cassette domain-containing protein [Streptococcus sp. zg-86]|uniref:ATP-binding cassette domain-containing protein n=1 Tax=Streptococcus zhangguiae TaxID=2664091 RepID=A0A6I4RGA8_9STRE|nr:MULTISPECIES: ABC transporter transmembrane domain-containing protein [unclassified Streptococcus]MTB63916.1 ATP-binding cassette domain-containing protein [Streptococcus sp. zg-86]MTB90227.1 ATP-binding cassette domain-containing protein [Streptococcus sp. zg-36]MWV55897.1 ATP-binding cassette domain-containing protein [Streptococcus sp. zg-70]QTH46948.1 ATP-binding cassette domain-containing protein [Streptococcus sp. zg-86]
MTVIKDFWWFFKEEKRRYLIGIASLVLVTCLNVLPPKIMGGVIDKIVNSQLNKGDLLTQLFFLILVALAMYGLRYLWRMYLLGTSYRLGQVMRYRFFEQLTKMSPSFYQQYRTGDLMAHATNDMNALTRLAGVGVLTVVNSTMTGFITLLTMSVTISWQLTLVAVLPLPFMVLATTKLGHKLQGAVKESRLAFSELTNKVQESVAGIKVSKSFGYQAAELADFQTINELTFVKKMQTMTHQSLLDPLSLLFIGVSYVLTLMIGAKMLTQGQITIGDLIAFVSYLDMLVWPLMALGFLVNLVQRGRVSYERLRNVLSQKSEITEVENPIESIANGPLVYHVEQFSYADDVTLSDVHFVLEKGQTLGLVGQIGSGKTSLIKLLLREYDVTKGSICLNGFDIRNYRLSDLRNVIGYVPQEPFLFATTILENVRFGNPSLSLAEVEAATKLSQVYEDVIAMPDGFSTLIGEKGVSLSGGQKQRLAMSRAMILDPDILILDDALSAVDAKTEHAIIENLKETRQAKTTIITAHRLSAVVHADLILVMQNGQIIERGRHEDLLNQGGWYAQTYALQQLTLSISY